MFRFNRPHLPLGPLKGGGLRVVDSNERINGLAELTHTGETGPAQRLSSQQAEPDLDLVEPRGVRGSEVQMHVRMLP